MMMRNLALVLAWLGYFITLNSYGLGLSSIEVRSNLNEPLDAQIRVMSIPRGDIDNLKASLASQEAFARAGLERPIVLTDLNFDIEPVSNSEAFIKITTQAPLTEPFLNFLIEVNWPSGRIMREYTALLDPPAYAPETRFMEVAEPRVAGLSVPQKLSYLPPATTQTQQAPQTPTNTFSSQATSRPVYIPPSAVQQQPLTAANNTQSYKVVRNDSLWKIAKRTQPAGVSLNDHMVAIFRANPDAFIRNNMNLIRAGKTISIPNQVSATTVRLASVAPSQPIASASLPIPQPKPATVSTLPDNASWGEPTPPESSVDVRVPGVERDGGVQQGVIDKLQARVRSLENELENERARILRENESLREDLNKTHALLEKMNEQISNMKELIEIKNQDLAILEERLRVAENEQTGSMVDAPKPNLSSGEDKFAPDSATNTDDLPNDIEPPSTMQPDVPDVEGETPTSEPTPEVETNTSTLAQIDPTSESPPSGDSVPTPPVDFVNEPVVDDMDNDVIPSTTSGDALSTRLERSVDAVVDASEKGVRKVLAKTEFATSPQDVSDIDVTVPPEGVVADAPTSDGVAQPVSLTPPTPPAKADKGMVGNLMDTANGLVKLVPGGWMTLGGGLLLLVLLLIFLATRRGKKTAAEEEEEIQAAMRELEEQERLAEQAGVEQTKVADDGEEAAQMDVDDLIKRIGADDIDTNIVDSDLIDEVDVYLSYERYEQAEELLKDALERQPQNNEYRTKLLEVYAASGNVDAFETEAKIVHEQTGGDGHHWDKTQALWDDMQTGRTLFSGDGSSALATAAAVAGGAAAVGLAANALNEDDSPPSSDDLASLEEEMAIGEVAAEDELDFNLDDDALATDTDDDVLAGLDDDVLATDTDDDVLAGLDDDELAADTDDDALAELDDDVTGLDDDELDLGDDDDLGLDDATMALDDDDLGLDLDDTAVDDDLGLNLDADDSAVAASDELDDDLGLDLDDDAAAKTIRLDEEETTSTLNDEDDDLDEISDEIDFSGNNNTLGLDLGDADAMMGLDLETDDTVSDLDALDDDVLGLDLDDEEATEVDLGTDEASNLTGLGDETLDLDLGDEEATEVDLDTDEASNLTDLGDETLDLDLSDAEVTEVDLGTDEASNLTDLGDETLDLDLSDAEVTEVDLGTDEASNLTDLDDDDLGLDLSDEDVTEVDLGTDEASNLTGLDGDDLGLDLGDEEATEVDLGTDEASNLTDLDDDDLGLDLGDEEATAVDLASDETSNLDIDNLGSDDDLGTAMDVADLSGGGEDIALDDDALGLDEDDATEIDLGTDDSVSNLDADALDGLDLGTDDLGSATDMADLNEGSDELGLDEVSLDLDGEDTVDTRALVADDSDMSLDIDDLDTDVALDMDDEEALNTDDAIAFDTDLDTDALDLGETEALDTSDLTTGEDLDDALALDSDTELDSLDDLALGEDDTGLDVDALSSDDDLAALSDEDDIDALDLDNLATDDDLAGADLDTGLVADDGDAMDLDALENLEDDSGIDLDTDGNMSALLGDTDTSDVDLALDEGDDNLDDLLAQLADDDDASDLLAAGEDMGTIDDIDSKFDLAQLYINSSDAEAAKTVLQEIVAEGDEVQKQKAEAMMAELA